MLFERQYKLEKSFSCLRRDSAHDPRLTFLRLTDVLENFLSSESETQLIMVEAPHSAIGAIRVVSLRCIGFYHECIICQLMHDNTLHISISIYQSQ